MRRSLLFAMCVITVGLGGDAFAQSQPSDPIATLVGRLDLDRYKATIKALTQFGDRRQGTDRNRAAIDWIETQLKSYGCATERFAYEYPPPGGAPIRVSSVPVTADFGVGGGRRRGVRLPTGINEDPNKQPNLAIRQLNSQPSTPGAREEIYCTKVGSERPQEMYIVSAHMDGQGWGEAANDNGSGTALVMELARLLSSPGVKTSRSIRFILWNNEETGLNGATAYVRARAPLQGQENPVGSGKYPEPKWLGMIQHDMLLFDHGMPRPDGTLAKEQRPEADINVEYQESSKLAGPSQALAWELARANEAYAATYPVTIGAHMTNTDSTPFQDFAPSISVRENERGTQVGNGWDPHWHQPTDIYANFSDKDFQLGLNAAQTTLAAVARLSGATLTGR